MNQPEAKNSTEVSISTALDFLDTVIGKLPEEDQRSYQKAKELCPQLVKEESDPEVYLRYENFNPWTTAIRLSNYWKIREECFGDRAFRKLDLSSEGVFNPEEIQVIKEGKISWTVLPPTKNGEAVLFFDRDSRNQGNEMIVRNRKKFTFFHMACISMDKNAQRNGFVIMAKMSARTAEVQDQGYKRGLALVGSLPVKMSRLCIVVPPTQGRERHFLLDTIIPIAEQRLIRNFCSEFKYYSDSSAQDLIASLEKDGFNKTGVPEVLGGSLKHSSYSNPRLLEQRLVERALSEYVAKKAAHQAFLAASVPLHTTKDSSLTEKAPHAEHTATKPLPPKMNPEAAKEEKAMRARVRRREKDVIYSRRKRLRQKERHEQIFMDSIRLKEENSFLKEEGERLEGLVKQASNLVETLQKAGIQPGVQFPVGLFPAANSGLVPPHISMMPAMMPAQSLQLSVPPANTLDILRGMRHGR